MTQETVQTFKSKIIKGVEYYGYECSMDDAGFGQYFNMGFTVDDVVEMIVDGIQQREEDDFRNEIAMENALYSN